MARRGHLHVAVVLRATMLSHATRSHRRVYHVTSELRLHLSRHLLLLLLLGTNLDVLTSLERHEAQLPVSVDVGDF